MSNQCDTCAFNQDTPDCLRYLLDRTWAQLFPELAKPVDPKCPHYLEQILEECDIDVSELI